MKDSNKSFLFKVLTVLTFFLFPLSGFAYQEHSGYISESTTWRAVDNPHVIINDVYITGDGCPILSLEPGVVVKFNAGKSLWVGYSKCGGLMAVGTEAERILFTSNTTPAPGSWKQIYFRNGTDDANSQLIYCDIEYGGYSDVSTVYIEASSPSIENCTIRGGMKNGIEMASNAFPSIINSTITENAKYGIEFKNNSGAEVFTGNTISDNGLNPVYIYAEYLRTLGSGNTYSGNNPDIILVQGQRVRLFFSKTKQL